MTDKIKVKGEKVTAEEEPAFYFFHARHRCLTLHDGYYRGTLTEAQARAEEQYEDIKNCDIIISRKNLDVADLYEPVAVLTKGKGVNTAYIDQGWRYMVAAEQKKRPTIEQL